MHARSRGSAADHLLLPSFDLLPDFERQLDSGRCHSLGHEGPDGLIYRRSGDRLAVPVPKSAMCSVADIPGLLLAAHSAISNAEMPATSTAYCTALQQRRALTRRRSSCQFISSTIRREQLEVLLILLPTDVAGMSIWDAGEPVTTVVLLLDLLLAVGSSPIPATAVHVHACVSGVCHAEHSSHR